MSSTVQPMPARATVARSMPFVFAPVDAMTLPLAFRPACSIRGQAMRFEQASRRWRSVQDA